MRYFNTSSYLIAMNAKVGCSTVARAVIRDFYPEVEAKIQSAHYPANKGPENTQWQMLCPSTDFPEATVLLLVRNPAERFRSAMAQLQLTDVGAVLDSLEGNETTIQGPRGNSFKARDNMHFWPQFGYTKHGQTTKLYRFPDHLDNLAVDAGLSLPLPTINEATHPKPDLTTEQEGRVRAYYAADVTMFGSITAPGQEHEPYVDPEQAARLLAEAKAEALGRLEHQAALAGEQGVLVNEHRMRTAKDARQNYLEALTLAQALPDEAPCPLWDADGQKIELTAAEARTLIQQYAIAAATGATEYYETKEAIEKWRVESGEWRGRGRDRPCGRPPAQIRT